MGSERHNRFLAIPFSLNTMTTLNLDLMSSRYKKWDQKSTTIFLPYHFFFFHIRDYTTNSFQAANCSAHTNTRIIAPLQKVNGMYENVECIKPKLQIMPTAIRKHISVSTQITSNL